MKIYTKAEMALVALVIVGGAGLYWWGKSASSVPEYFARYAGDKTSYEILMEENPSFRTAQELSRQGDRSAARTAYEEALTVAQDPVQEGQIKIKIANLYQNAVENGEYRTAIPLLKEIILNESYPRITRAYALQQMTTLYFSYADPVITEEIFRDQPFASAYDPRDIDLSYHRLLLQASSLYPLALIELRIADRSAYALSDSLLGGQPETSAQLQNYRDDIAFRLANANRDIERIKFDENEKGGLPAILQRKAIVVARLAAAGEDFGDWEQSFEDLLALHSLRGPQSGDGYAIFHYARFLARIGGEARHDDVRALLAKLHGENVAVYKGSKFEVYVRNEKDNVLGVKSDFVLLASIDPDFKAYLKGLGWSDTDFE
jgi:hypothetical protein